MSNNHYNRMQSSSRLPEVTVRPANGHDGAALERLAQLDSSRVPAGPVIVAEVGGEIRAAASMLDGIAIADPFRPTAGLVAMLRAQAGYAPGASRSAVRPVGRSLWRRSGGDQALVPAARAS